VLGKEMDMEELSGLDYLKITVLAEDSVLYKSPLIPKK